MVMTDPIADMLTRIRNANNTLKEEVSILSTSQGLMTDKEARAKQVGGEVLAYIW